MRLSDLLLNKAVTKERPAEETRTVDVTSAEMVEELRMDSARAMAKINEIPKDTVGELRPFFSPDFFGKPGEA